MHNFGNARILGTFGPATPPLEKSHLFSRQQMDEHFQGIGKKIFWGENQVNIAALCGRASFLRYE